MDKLHQQFKWLIDYEERTKHLRFPPIPVGLKAYNLFMKMSNPNVQAMSDLINADKKADKVKSDAQDTAIKAVTDKAVKDLGGSVVTDIVDKQVILGAPKPVEAVVNPILKGLAAEQKTAHNAINVRADEMNKDLKKYE